MPPNNTQLNLEALYATIDANVAVHQQARPCIGLSVNVKGDRHNIADAYVQSILKSGGCPVVIPMQEDLNALVCLLDKIDALVLTGGGDLHPAFFHETPIPSIGNTHIDRDVYDLTLIRLAADRQIPLLGICRGLQVINVAFGGNLYQDIPTQYQGKAEGDIQVEHNQTTPKSQTSHTVRIDRDSCLYRILQRESLEVNSFHHQAIKNLAPVLKATAYAPDGIVEAFESNNCHRIWGVQWHPEGMAAAGNRDMLTLFRRFVDEAELFRQAKRIHHHSVSVDSHCDAPMYFSSGIDIGKKNPTLKVDIPKMYEGRLDAVFMVAYLKQKERTPEADRQAFDKTVALLTELKRQIDRHPDIAGLARSAADIHRLKSAGKKAILMGIENACGMGGNVENLRLFKTMGVSYITLCHNGNNDLCDSATDQPEHNGLSALGRETVREMNRLGIMVDISHASEKAAFDAIEASRQPVIASHSSVRSLYNHRRNVSDDLIRAIAAKSGVVQVCLYDAFLAGDASANIRTAVEHIHYIVQLVGVDYAGIGSDFDGGGGLPGINAANEMINITVELLRRQYKASDIRKILGENLLRVMDNVQQNE
jgi:microsomal dipeptidase-like Zn-dependent dipeptidase/gamma-glutamyl-gamma-aminobutyrate hydrolase PuuD